MGQVFYIIQFLGYLDKSDKKLPWFEVIELKDEGDTYFPTFGAKLMKRTMFYIPEQEDFRRAVKVVFENMET